MAPASPQQSDSSMSLLWIIVGFLVLVIGIFIFYGVPILQSYLNIKQYEASFIRYVLSIPGQWIHLNFLSPERLNAVQGDLMARVTDVNQATFDRIQRVAAAVGWYLRVPAMVIIFIFAALVYFTNSASRYTKTYTMKRLLLQEKENWPQVAPVSVLDLVKQDIDEGPWAMAMNPIQFAKAHGLLKLEKQALVAGQLSRESKILSSVHIGKANKVFALQCGVLWRGSEFLNPHTKALFTAFIARAHGDIAGSTGLMKQLAISATKGSLDYTGVDKILNKYKDSKIVQRVVARHAYVLTVMASILQLARSHGILATADFIWLKPLDRSLWFMLNAVGRQTPFTEIAGPFSHWLAEKTLERRLIVPQIDEAGKALDFAVREIIYQPDEDEHE